jgi:hypothetical protein
MNTSRRDVLKFSLASAFMGISGCSRRTLPNMPENVTHSQDTPALPDRIIFPGNPWPNGHAIINFRWSARIEPSSGLWFDLCLESANYNADDPVKDVEEISSPSNWTSRIVWRNYRNCILSSTDWNNVGFKVTRDQTLFDFDSLNRQEFRVDPLPVREEDTPAFGIYLQGHDSAADHRISFKKLEDKNNWSIAWQGRVALTYLGDDRFINHFKALVTKTSFDGINLPLKTTKEEAESLLRRFVAKPDQFKLEHVGE